MKALSAEVCTLLLIAASAVSAVSAGAQDLLPPDPGWAVSGSSTLADPLSVYGPVLRDPMQVPGKFRWGLALSNPYSVKGLNYTGAYVSLPAKSGEYGGGWKQLRGDGLNHMEVEVRYRRIILLEPPQLCLSMAAGYQALTGTGTRRLAARFYRLGISAAWLNGLRAALLFNGDTGGRDGWMRSWIGLAGGWQNEKFALRAGGLLSRGEQLEPSLSLVCYLAHLRLDIGAWGTPPMPAAGLHLTVRKMRWSVEGRWVPGLGFNLLWSISSTSGGKK